MNSVKELLEQLGMCSADCLCEYCASMHWKNGCDYGKPCGPEDWDGVCSCED